MVIRLLLLTADGTEVNCFGVAVFMSKREVDPQKDNIDRPYNAPHGYFKFLDDLVHKMTELGMVCNVRVTGSVHSVSSV